MGGRGGNSGLGTAESEAYRNVLSVVENGIKYNSTETAVCLDKDGNIIFDESQGHAHQVAFTPDQVSQMKDNTLTHNHPSGSTFSSEDIQLLVHADMKEIRATSEQRTYRLERIDGTFSNRADFANDYAMAYQANKVITDAKWAQIENDYSNGRISTEECDRKAAALNVELNNMNSKWLMDNSHQYGYRYRVI